MAKKNVTVYKVLISCPSDVKPFVSGIEQAIHRFNRIIGFSRNVMLLPVYYEESSYSEMGDYTQSLLNRQIVDDSDLAISVFWTRFGSPTKYHDSGTEEEIDYMRGQEKQVFLYFLNKDVPLKSLDYKQLEKLDAFKRKIGTSSLSCEVDDEEELYSKIYDQLGLHFNQKINGEQLLNSKKKRSVLWVDDRPENNVYERRTLEHYGVEVFVALSTDQAMFILESNDISLIISDMGRKEGPREGYVLLEKVRMVDKSIPFYIYGGSNDPKHTEEALQLGANGNICYPDILLDRVIQSLLKI